MWKNILVTFIVVVVIAFAVFLAYNFTNPQRQPSNINKQGNHAPSRDYYEDISSPKFNVLKDYFPTGIGTILHYQIAIGGAEPLWYNETKWDLRDKVITFSNRGRFVEYYMERGRKVFDLIIKIKGIDTKQGILSRDLEVEFEVIKDELGIFRNSKRIYWAISLLPRYEVILLITYDPIYAPSIINNRRDFNMREDGYSMRFIFFGSEPGIAMGIGENPQDKLLFQGTEDNAPGYEGQEILHFIRKVKEEVTDNFSDNEITKGFTEDMWFMKGRGLIRLEQKINNTISMTWILL